MGYNIKRRKRLRSLSGLPDVLNTQINDIPYVEKFSIIEEAARISNAQLDKAEKKFRENF